MKKTAPAFGDERSEMMNKEYKWHGHVYRIAEEDLDNYPGAELLEKAAPKKEDKAAPAAKNKAVEPKGKKKKEK